MSKGILAGVFVGIQASVSFLMSNQVSTSSASEKRAIHIDLKVVLGFALKVAAHIQVDLIIYSVSIFTYLVGYLCLPEPLFLWNKILVSVLLEYSGRVLAFKY